MSAGRVVVYGGKGALGSKCVEYFKENNYWVGSIDLAANPEADLNIVLEKDDPVAQQEVQVLHALAAKIRDDKLDAVICVAGGWAGGNAKKDLLKTAELMWRQSVWSSVISTSVAATYLKTGGLLTLTGAKAALDGTPGMIGYGAAKAAVHQITRSLAKDGGLPDDAVAVAILPVTLDTPMNRKWMPDADHSSWTPLEFVADLFLRWTQNSDRPPSGSLVQLITKNAATETVLA